MKTQTNLPVVHNHPHGAVFVKTMEHDRISYSNAFGINSTLPNGDVHDWVTVYIRHAIGTGEWPKLTNALHVRSPIPGPAEWIYHPLSVIFATPEQQVSYYDTHGLKLPSNSWFKAKRNLVRKLVLLPKGE